MATAMSGATTRRDTRAIMSKVARSMATDRGRDDFKKKRPSRSDVPRNPVANGSRERGFTSCGHEKGRSVGRAALFVGTGLATGLGHGAAWVLVREGLVGRFAKVDFYFIRNCRTSAYAVRLASYADARR